MPIQHSSVTSAPVSVQMLKQALNRWPWFVEPHFQRPWLRAPGIQRALSHIHVGYITTFPYPDILTAPLYSPTLILCISFLEAKTSKVVNNPKLWVHLKENLIRYFVSLSDRSIEVSEVVSVRSIEVWLYFFVLIAFLVSDSFDLWQREKFSHIKLASLFGFRIWWPCYVTSHMIIFLYHSLVECAACLYLQRNLTVEFTTLS